MQAPERTLANARRLRKQMTLPEVLVWNMIRRDHIDGHRFRRQHPLGPFVLDFYCDEVRLAIEVDGAMHDQPDQIRHDRERDAWLAARGIEVLRLPARYVLENADGLFEMIRFAAQERAGLRGSGTEA